MVGRADLMNAIALNSSMFNCFARGRSRHRRNLVASIGEGWCFFVNGVSYIAVIIGLLMMRVAAPASWRTPDRRWRTSSKASASSSSTAPCTRSSFCSAWSAYGHAVHRADADLRRQDPARRRQGSGHVDGRDRRRRAAAALLLASRKSLKGLGTWVALSAAASARAWSVFSLCRSYLLSVLLLIPVGLRHHDRDGIVQYADPEHGARPTARPRDGGLLDDVHGHGAGRIAARGRGGRRRRAVDGGRAAASSAWRRRVFWAFLPHIRVGARQLIVAQQMAGAEPPQEMTGGGLELQPSNEGD